uniref:Uncharacterized protein LOC111107104 isoform X12 n=1 Tax=Crassostrea virginica TaxID=6565 RepID=A0A8B8B313_CRAVI|nr:uncharacterized protein LOC111107104 isoform X12 [Crassostrea virginica]
MPGIPDRVHFEDEVILKNIKLDAIDEERLYKQRVEEILNPNNTYLTDLQGPDELGEDFGFEPEDAYFVPPSESDDDYVEGLEDPMLYKIKGQIAKNLKTQESDTSSEISTQTLDSAEQETELNIHYSEHFTSVPYGVLPKATYTHGRKNADIMGIVYNGRMRQFVILDGKGITTWKRDPGLNGESRIRRALMYPKYEYRLISYLVYAKKFNCYFALGKDFSLKVLNRDFIETCSVSANLRSVLFMLFNPVGDELITGGVGGTTIWKFEQDATKQLTEIKPLANYRLRRVRDLKDVGGSWVKRVDLDFTLQHLYCCSDTDLYAYDLKGQLLFKFLKAHTMSITGCIYSQFSKTLLTCSIDTEVKMWSLRGGLVHTFRGHSRAVTSIVVHPIKTSIIVTASLDGSVKMWSLNTMEILYSVVISTDGLLWMGMTDDSLMFCATVRNITLWNLNQFYDFFAVARSRICRLSLAACENKTTRVVAEGQDSSMRLFSRKNQKNLTTVLPPPDISPLQRVLSVCYSREYNMVFVLITPMDIWVYTTKTDPSCRVMTWNVHDLQLPYLSNKGKKDSENPLGGWSSSLQGGPAHRATENGLGNEALSACHSLCILTSTATMWTEEGFCSPIQNMDLEETYLLMGLEDGRILFMDPVTKGKKYMEFKASKDAIQEMRHDIDHSALITTCHLKELAMIQIWSLPQLQLLHELYCSLDTVCYSRMDQLFMTGHLSGCVNFYSLEPAEDWGLFRAKIEPNKDTIVKKKRPEHNAEVVAIDSSTSIRIFCSASLNGVIRIWDENKHLVTEIFMDKLEIDENIIQEEPGVKKIKVDEQGRKEKVEDEANTSASLQDKSLSAACFLNKQGDLIIGFKNHIFFIDHTRVCPHLTVSEEEEEVDKESAIIEDPSVIYEGGVYLPEPVTLENYLVPFDFIDFSKDFLEGKIDLEESSEDDEGSETDSTLSLAPTEIYQSPLDSPWSRSMIDLTLDSEMDKYDLRQRMNLTLEEIQRRDGKMKKRRKAGGSMDGDVTPHASDKESEGEGLPKFDFPMFGNSPGPSPIPTPPSHPATPEIEEVPEEAEPPPQKPLDDNFVLKEVPQADANDAANAQKQQAEVKTDSSDEEEVIPDHRNKYRLDNIKIDVKGLMKGARHTVKKQPRKQDPSPARSDHTHAKPDEQLLTPEELLRKQAEEERRLERVKKQMLKDRKFPKRGTKPTRAELIAEQRRLEELKKQHPYGVAPQLTQQLNKPKEEEKKDSENAQEEPKEDYPLVQYEQPDLDSFQDELWNPRETGVSGTSLMGTKLDLPQIKRGAAGTPGPRIVRPPTTPTPMSRGATPLPPENNNLLQVPSTPTPGSKPELSPEIDKIPDEMRRELHSRQGRISALKGRDEEEVDRDNLTPDIETAVQKQWSAMNDLPERPRSETPTAALKKLSESRKKTPKLIRVDLPKESEGVDTYRSRLASPISEMTEDRSHLSGHEADDEMIDHRGHKKHYRTRKERSLLTKDELKYIHQRPNSSFHRPKTAEKGQENVGKEDVVRPKTAHVRFQAESPVSETEKVDVTDLQNAFEDALERYNSIHGESSPDKSKLLYRNDGNNFEENWQEREIERHMLLRMQKALRSKSAAQKRQVWEEQLEEKRQKLQRESDTQSALGFNLRPESSFFALTQVERANTSMSYMPPLSTAKPTVQLPKRPKTAAANLQRQQTEKTALKVEKPFRYKIRQGGSESQLSRPPSRQASEPSISPRMVDPRNPNSLRPPSTKSIPSKCTRYILVSKQKQKPGLPLPTPLEEQLLAERFPSMGERVFRQHSELTLRSKKVSYCVEYTPFVNQWA